MADYCRFRSTCRSRRSTRSSAVSEACFLLQPLPRFAHPPALLLAFFGWETRTHYARVNSALIGSLVRLTRPFFSKRRAMLLTVGGSTPKHSHNSDCRHAPRKLPPGTSRKRPVRSAGPGDANVHRLHYGRSDTPAREDSRDPVQSWSRSGKRT